MALNTQARMKEDELEILSQKYGRRNASKSRDRGDATSVHSNKSGKSGRSATPGKYAQMALNNQRERND